MTHPSSRRMPAALLLAFVVLLPGCTLGLGEAEAGGGVRNPGGADLIPVADREPAPDVCGETTEGDALCLAELAGTPTLVNFWASWCGPCAAEIPELVDVDEAYGGQVALVGVNLKDSLVNARSFERDQAVTYPSLYDDTSAIAGAFGGIAPEALPSTILLDDQHRVALRLFGAVTRPQLEPLLDELLVESGVPRPEPA